MKERTIALRSGAINLARVAAGAGTATGGCVTGNDLLL